MDRKERISLIEYYAKKADEAYKAHKTAEFWNWALKMLKTMTEIIVDLKGQNDE